MIVGLKVDRVQKEPVPQSVEQTARVITIRPVRKESEQSEPVHICRRLPVRVVSPLDRLFSLSAARGGFDSFRPAC